MVQLKVEECRVLEITSELRNSSSYRDPKLLWLDHVRVYRQAWPLIERELCSGHRGPNYLHSIIWFLRLRMGLILNAKPSPVRVK